MLGALKVIAEGMGPNRAEPRARLKSEYQEKSSMVACMQVRKISLPNIRRKVGAIVDYLLITCSKGSCARVLWQASV